MLRLPKIALSLAGCEYLFPYFERQFPIPDDSEDEFEPAIGGVKIIVDGSDDTIDSEFYEYCQEHSLPVVVIRCPAVVCTGMQGLPRRIAEGVYKGSFCHIADNDSRISVVHGIDVAAAAALALGCEGTYVLTDGTNPTIRELAEAIAYRINDKRIFTVKPWMAKMWFGHSYYDELTSDHVAESTFGQAFAEFIPHPVVFYLRTHVYDEASL